MKLSIRKGRVRSVLKYLFLLTAAGLLLWFSFKGVSWSDFKAGLAETDYRWVAGAVLASLFVFLLRAARWRLIMLPARPDLKLTDAWDGINIGYLGNFVIPRAGELARCGVITARTNIPFKTVFGTVVLERAVDLICLFLATLFVLIFRWGKFGSFMDREIFSAMEERFSGMFLPILAIIIAALAIFLYAAYKYRGNSRFYRKIADTAKGVIDGLKMGFRMPAKWLFLLYSIAIWTGYWTMSYTTILAFSDISLLGPMDAVFLMVVGSFGWVIPVQGGIGAYHLIISIALSSIYGISQTTGIVFATISHESQALTMIVCGVVSLIHISIKKRREQ